MGTGTDSSGVVTKVTYWLIVGLLGERGDGNLLKKSRHWQTYVWYGKRWK
jgi:hypothetical protein